MAGSIFFSSPTSAARGKVLLFLLITMTPFMLIAPVLGPALDRMKGGRRLFLISSAAGRALLCMALAMYISKPAPEGLLVYPLAFGVLVLQKGSAIAKSALVPALVNDDAELVTANSRLALINAIGAAVGAAPAFVVYKLFGADWSLRYGAVVFVVATILAIQIPRTRLREPTDEQQQQLVREEMHTPSILLGSSAFAVLRASVGFLVFFAAFSLKGDLVALGVAGAAAYVGNFGGVIVAPALRRSFREEVILASSLVLPAILTAARRAGGGLDRLHARGVVDRHRRRGGPARVRQPLAARRPRCRARARLRQVRDALPAGVGDRRDHRDHPVRQADGLVPARGRARLRGDLVRRRAARRRVDA